MPFQLVPSLGIDWNDIKSKIQHGWANIFVTQKSHSWLLICLALFESHKICRSFILWWWITISKLKYQHCNATARNTKSETLHHYPDLNNMSAQQQCHMYQWSCNSEISLFILFIYVTTKLWKWCWLKFDRHASFCQVYLISDSGTLAIRRLSFLARTFFLVHAGGEIWHLRCLHCLPNWTAFPYFDFLFLFFFAQIKPADKQTTNGGCKFKNFLAQEVQSSSVSARFLQTYGIYWSLSCRNLIEKYEFPSLSVDIL